jgi:hypothetical protein
MAGDGRTIERPIRHADAAATTGHLMPGPEALPVLIAPARGADRIRTTFGAAATALLLIALLVLPVAAVSGSTKLLDPVVSPVVGTPTTTFTFAVTYRNREGSEPDLVSVVIDGVSHAMTAEPGNTGWKAGVRFSWSTKLPIGTHEVGFVGTGRDKFSDAIAGATVTVSLPATPTPTPTPRPTPDPTPRPTPSPTPTPTPTPIPTPRPTPDPEPTTPATPDPSDPPASRTPSPPGGVGPTVPPVGNGSSGPGEPAGSDDPTVPAPTDGPGGGVDGPAPGGGTGGGGAAGPAGPGSVPDPGDPNAGSGDGKGTDQFRGGWGELSKALSTLGLDASAPAFGAVPVMITTTGAVAMTMAFLFFGKRRRDGEAPEPDEALAAAAARGTGQVATGALVGQTVVPLTPMDPDAGVPRWRRPSLLEARKADPLRDAVVMQTMRFDHGLVGPLDGHERRVIRYHVVRLLDTPDELRGAEIGTLNHGDEVQLLERTGTYWMVLCPDGRKGWIHKMTLGDVVGADPAPTAQQTWATASDEPDEVDDDVLTAFMAARGRA